MEISNDVRLVDGTSVEIPWLEDLLSGECGSKAVISKVEPLSSDTIGYMSVMRRVFLQNEDGTPFTPESVIVKSPSSSGATEAITAAGGVEEDTTPDNTEECRALILIANHKALHNIKIPKIYAANDISSKFPCIVMEDLRESHVIDVIDGLSEKHLYQLVDQIVEIQAFSLQIDEWRQPETERSIKLIEECGPLFKGMFTKLFSTYPDIFGDLGWKLMENIVNKEGHFLNNQRKYTKGERKSVLCHGDMWSSNFLWKGEELTAIIDWQLMHAGSPVEDILHILSTCTSAENRKTLTKPLLDYYYSRLQEKVDKMPFTRIELDEEVHFYKPDSCVWTIFANAFWISEVLRTEERIKESLDRCVSYLQETVTENGW